MIDIDKEECLLLQAEITKLEREFEPIRESLTLVEKFEVLSRDEIAAAGRRQNELQSLIRHAKHVIAERKANAT